MLAGRRLDRRRIMLFGVMSGGKGVLWAAIVYAVYILGGVEWLRIPWMPISVIGIAVSFYVGFKNNASYDRFWEGRKIWGGVVNESRSWASQVLCYVLPGDTSPEAHAIRQDLIYRQLAWVNALRVQLRSTSRFHAKPERSTAKRLESHSDHMRNHLPTELAPFLSEAEIAEVSQKANGATHLIHNQGLKLTELLRAQKMDLFHQIALMEILRELYALQGKAERIKKTPFPRLYAEFSTIFTRLFVVTVPFGLLDVFADHIPAGLPTADNAAWLLPYFAAAGAISWVFLTTESIGSASEDPFERSMNDVPMNALSIVIERDLRELLGETDIPDPELPIDNILY